MTKENKVPIHEDKLGRPINEGSFVVYPSYNSLGIGKVVKLNPKMVKVQRVPVSKWKDSSLKYPADLVVIADQDVTLYLLKNSG